jgi:flagellar motor protein MotB
LSGFSAFAQKASRKDVLSPDEEKLLLLEKFTPTDTASVLQLPSIDFKNINVIPEYYKPAKLAEISRLKKNKQWDLFMKSLYEYVSNFGINNFIHDIDLIWQLARVAEYMGNDVLVKELYRLIIKHHRGDLQEALNYYDSITVFERPLYANIEDYYRLVERRKQIDTLRPPAKIQLDMGDEVNSEFDDYGLSIGGNDNIIYFTSNRNPRKSMYPGLVPTGQETEDIYISMKDEDDNWGPAQPFEGINTRYKEGSPCVSKDGRTIVFARCNSPDGYGNCDLFISYYQEKTKDWSEAVNLGPDVNSYAWDSHPAFSITEDTLFFSSDRKGGFGGTDIYFSVKDKKTGKWGKAQNIGPVINTRASEVSPFPHPKYNVLYFSSNGHLLNFGDFDIFKTYLLDGKWTEPKNVGPLVNGQGSEFYFTIDSQSKWLFYAKSKENLKDLDLKSFPLPMEAKPNNLIRFSGRVKEPVTGAVFEGVVTIIDRDEGVEVAPRKIRDDGSFEFELIDKRNYLLIIEGDNFFRIEELFYLDGDMERDYEAHTVHKTITFEAIDFAPNSAKLEPEMENNLHLVIDFLVTWPQFNLRITGHTDLVGSQEFNLQLSQRRADAIRAYILDYGNLSPDRVEAIGMGKLKPIKPVERTEEDRKLNRRVEFELIRNE